MAGVLDSPEAKGVRRIVTDHIDDVGAALAGVGQRADLVCIYGGDGTIFHVLNELLRIPGNGKELPRIFLLGGGTMNVTATWLGMGGTPADNFRAVMMAYQAGTLRYRKVPLLRVRSGETEHFGFTFGTGPLVRLLDRYEHGGKGKLSALVLGLRAAGSAISPLRSAMSPLLDVQNARVVADGRPLDWNEFAAVFANTTGAVQRLVAPFVGERPADQFHFLAYAVSSREMAARLPWLAQAKRPLDAELLRKPFSAAQKLWTGAGLPRDPRYVNGAARRLLVETTETIFTIDGEVLPTEGPFEVSLGPELSLAAHP